ncbi:hypothetical protein C8R43DRAFT_908060 [Mycena crocata]|nr:hypothetical protein C8R43DRAFT_908078 [Mycena crocata]KAJ7093642.1 hypothetical protein C8R43DRAFT_908060 [Mycena crocata]
MQAEGGSTSHETGANPAPPAPPPTPTIPMHGAGKTQEEGSRAVVVPEDAPEWFMEGMRVVSEINLGPTYVELLRAFAKLEESTGFAGSKVLSTAKRPTEVKGWVKDARRTTPWPIANLGTFTKSWWAWWSALQPAWRGGCRGQGEAGKVVPAGADWGKLVVPGRNGLLTVVATVYWWGCKERENGSCSEEWHEAVGDVLWVLRSLTEPNE